MKDSFSQFPIHFVLGACILFAPAAHALARTTKLAPTPPMGWNTWYAFGCKIAEAQVRAEADALMANGMKEAGYNYVNLDDCWQGTRDAQGNIHPSANFPDMKGLADYLHAHGFKFGIYSSPGPKTCGGEPGSYEHEAQDARTYARWGVDFLKYDWCSARNVYAPSQMQGAYKKMHEAILQTGRPMAYSLCQYGLEQVWTWGASVGGNMWRTTIDVSNRIDFQEYTRMAFVGFGQAGLERFAGPGRWNDPDMLQIGNHGLNEDEDRTQMSLWCLLAAPLIISSDLTKLTPAQLAILTNHEVIAVDQDPAGIQGHRVSQVGPLEVWMKPLANGTKAVGLFNRGEGPMTVKVNFGEITISGAADVRDLWAHKDLGSYRGDFSAVVPRHGVVMVLVRPL
ncbi:MAG: glycoside hydrolase family 27 protein [Acidobacteriota bacterium]|nr:glycoside hydrolase family 27 protein [Acidobacteriota bacterium]